MRCRRFTHWIIAGLIGLVWISESKAQTITTGALSVTQVCGTETISVPFMRTGAFGNGNTFSVELSNSAGNFSTPLVLSPSGTNSPLVVTIPNNLANGTGYQVRVVSSTPQVIGTASATVLTIQQTPAAPSVAQTSYIYCQNAPATPLTATVSGSNTLKWYDGSNTPLAGAPTPSTTSTGTQSFSVSQVSSTGCESPKVAITVQVNGIPQAPTAASPIEICEGSPTAPLSATGNNLKWYDASNNPLGGAPTPSNTTSSSYSVTQTVNGCESPKKTIDVTIKPKPAPPGVTASLSYCFGASIPPLTATGTGLRWYTSNDTQLAGAPTPSNTSPSSYRVSQTVNGCESDKATISVGIIQTPPPAVTASVEYCAGQAAAALSATGTDLKWYTAPSGGAALGGAPTPSTAAAGTTNYYVSQTANGCESARAQISVNVKALPDAPGVSAVELCEGGGAGPLTASGNNLTWYTAPSGGAALGGAPTPSTAAAGATSYYVSQTVNGCEGPRAKLDVTVKPKPAPPGVTATLSYCFGASIPPLTATGSGLKWYTSSDSPLAGAPTPSNTSPSSFKVSQTVNGCESDKATISIGITQTPPPAVTASVEYCAGQAAAALSATGTDLKWYTAPSGGAALGGAPTPSTAAAGTTNYYVSQTANGCESARAQISVTVKPLPAAPGVSAVELCEGSGAAPLTANGSNLTWYTAPSGGAALGGAPTPSTVAAGSTSYYVSQTVNGCEGPRATLTVTVKPKPAPPGVTASLNYCFGASIPPLTATGTGLKWYTANDTPLGGAPTPSNTFPSSYKVSQTVNGCESDKATISVGIIQTPPPAVTASVEYCTGQAAAALSATGTDLKWYTAPSGGAALGGAPTPSTAAAGTTNYYVSQTANGCESARAQVSVTVKATPLAPGVTSIDVCEGTSVGSLTASGVNLLWYQNATGGSGSSTNPVVNTGNVGTTSYYVSQSVNGCESPRAKLDVTIRDTPDAPVVTSTIPLCFGVPATALSATGTSLRWYTTPSGGTVLGGAPTPSTAAAGVTRYYVSQTANACEGPRAMITVTVYQTPAPAVTSTVEYCNNEPSVALSATGTELKWYTTSLGGSASSSAPTPSTGTVGTQTYYVSQTLNGCEGDRSRIDVITKPIPTLPTITAPAPICQGSPALPLLGSVSGATGTLRWYTAPTGGTGTSSAPTPNTATPGTITYFVTQTINNCESPRAALPVDVRALPAAPTATALVEYCETAAAQPLSASGDNLKWYNAAAGGNALGSAPTPNTAVVTTTSFYVSQTTQYSASLSCEGPRARIDVQINPLPGLPGVTAFQEFCQERQPNSFTLNANGSALKWYTAASGGAGSPSAPSVNLQTPGESTFYVSQTTTKGCEGGRSEMRVRVKPLPALPGVTPLVVYCQFDNPQPLTAAPQSNASLNWYGTNASGGNASGTAPTPSTQEGGETSFYVSQTLAGCEGDRAPITVRVNTTPKPGVTTPVEYCQNAAAQPLSAQGRDLKWYREPTSTQSQTNPFIPFTANVGNYSFYVTQTGTNNCESPKEKIDVRIKPLPSATITGDASISLGQSAQISIEFTGDGPWDYVLSNNTSGKGVTQNPLRITVSPSVTTTYVVTEVSNSCGKGIPNGSAIVTVRIPTISTGNPTIASLCAGRSFTIPFQASGDFVAENKFNAQISLTNTDSGFRTIPSVRNGNEVVATIPDTTRGGNYFVRVVGESPQFILAGSVSPVNITVQPLPTATLSGTTTILLGESATLNVALTGTSPWTFRFNNGSRDSLITTSVTPYVIPVTPAVTTTYSVTSVSNQCGNGIVSGTARIQVDLILGNEPALPASDWLTVYPSPVQTICIVEIKAPLTGGEAALSVFDMNGRTVLSNKIRSARTSVDFTAQPAGIYFLRIENGARTEVRRILKQN